VYVGATVKSSSTDTEAASAVRRGEVSTTTEELPINVHIIIIGKRRGAAS